MRIMKRLTALFIIATLMLGSIVAYADEYELKYSEEVAFLSAMNLIDADSVDMLKGCSRGEFARILFGIINNQEPHYSGAAVFSDVESDDPCFEAVSYMYDMKYMNGYSENIFDPDKYISYNEAISVIVRVLGYDVKSTALGGYSTGYVHVADEIKLLRGMIVSDHSALMLDEACKLIYNSMFVAMAEPILSADSVKYSTDHGNTLLNTYMGMDFAEGLLSDNSISSLTGSTNIKEGSVKVGDVYVDNVTEEAKNMLGHYVRIYYRELDAYNEFVYITELKNKNNVLEIAADKLIEPFSLSEITYETESNRVNSAKLSPEAYYIKNGEAINNISEDDFDISCGSIKLIDHNNDRVYDVIFINDCRTMVLQGINISKKVIYGKYGNKDILEFEDEEYVRVFDRNNERIGLDKLKEFDVLAVWQGVNYVKIEVCTDVVVGTLKSVSSDYFVINGQEHKIVKEYENSGLILPKVGVEGTFYFGKDGNIAFFETAQTQKVGIAVAIRGDRDFIEEDPTRIIIYTTNGKFETFEFKSKFKLSGVNTKIEDIYKKREFFNENGQFIRQVVMYEIGEQREIVSLDVEDKTKTGNDTLKSASGARNYVYCSAGTKAIGPSGDMEGQDNRAMFITANTLYFKIPEDIMAERYYSVSMGGLPYEHNYTLTNTRVFFTSANDEKTGVASVVVSNVATARSTSGWYNRGTVVVNIESGLDADGNVCDILEGYTDGELVKYYAVDGIKINGLEKGDMIQLTQNNNDIICYRKTYSIKHDMTCIEWYLKHKDDGKLPEFYSISNVDSVAGLGYYINKEMLFEQTVYSARSNNTLNTDKGGVYVTGTVTYKNGNYINVRDDNNVEYNFAIDENQFPYYRTSAYKVSMGRRKPETVKATTVNVGDRVCVITEAYSVMNMLIIE